MMSTVLLALVVMIGMASVIGLLLQFCNQKLSSNDNQIIDQIDATLPQTQCGQCGYPGCRPYATAIANEGEAINRCPPGGQAGVAALANLLGVDEIPLDEACGVEAPATVAKIVEADCIGCTLCIKACPVDAIIGTAKKMHTVIPELCTGCDLCLPPCPMDCIVMLPKDQQA